MKRALRHEDWRRRVFVLLDQGSSRLLARLIHGGLVFLIIVDVIAVVLESVPAIHEQHRGAFLAIEAISVVVFTVEYALRLWTAPENQRAYHGVSPWRARMLYAMTPAAIIDLIAILPVYIALFGESRFNVILLFRLFRFFKLARYSAGMHSLASVLYAERRALVACIVILVGMALIDATAMHLAESAVQPEKLGTIPDALWWAVVTLTTVGYGDVVPVTGLGKVIASLTALTGLVMLALPVGIIATAFSQDIHRREFVVTWSMVARVPLFAGLEAVQIAEILKYLRAKTVAGGVTIVRRGDVADSLYFIAEGAVEILGAHHRHLAGGDHFGELSLFSGSPRSSTIRALVPTKLLVLDSGDVIGLMNRHPELARRIHESAEARRQMNAALGSATAGQGANAQGSAGQSKAG